MLSCRANCSFDEVAKIGCIVSKIKKMETEQEVIKKCFEKAGLTSSYAEVRNCFNGSSFGVGTHLRDKNLPNVTDQYIDHCLSFHNVFKG